MKPIVEKVLAALIVPFALSGLAYALFLCWPHRQPEPEPSPTIGIPKGAATNQSFFYIWRGTNDHHVASIDDLTTNGFTLRTSFKPCEARVTNGQWTIHFKR